MTLATEAYDAYLYFCESHGIFHRQDECARAVLRAMHDHLEGYAGRKPVNTGSTKKQVDHD